MIILASGCLARTEEAQINQILDEIREAADRGQYQISFKRDLTDRQVRILQSLGFYATRQKGLFMAGVSWREPYAND